ncbi:MAG TPA: DNA alkylation repair protein [bacterium]|nr:DNA alkylation repair protein [bacterium]
MNEKQTEIYALAETIRSHADPEIAGHAQRFFKTGPGQYGEGDLFLGIRVPVLRKIARTHRSASLPAVEMLLHSEYHEERLTALLILVLQYAKGGDSERRAIFDTYLANTRYINNWDLVDLSAHKIIGPYLENRDRSVLQKLARSENLWERRIAILSTYHYICNGEYNDTLSISDLLLNDSHDLIHKAVGWMLREIGKRDRGVEEEFLKSRYRRMPRTMLRYAIEKFDEPQRQRYLKGRI